MAEITAALVKELRERTGAGMMDCKKALTETSGDIDKAIDFLREKGLAAAAKKAGRKRAHKTLLRGCRHYAPMLPIGQRYSGWGTKDSARAGNQWQVSLLLLNRARGRCRVMPKESGERNVPRLSRSRSGEMTRMEHRHPPNQEGCQLSAV